MNRSTSGPLRGSVVAWLVTGVGVFVAFVALLVGCNGVTKFKAVDQASVCIIKHGGPFDDRKFGDVRQPGAGLSFIGFYNQQQCIPASQRNYIVSADPTQGDQKGVDFVEVPTRDAVPVRIEGAAYFQMSSDPTAVRSFMTKFATRKFEGTYVYDSDGFLPFLDQNFRPQLDNALREAVGNFDCVQLNASCQYVTSAEEAVKGNVKKVATGQNLAQAQTQIEQALQSDLNSTLGAPPQHPYFENIHFRLRKVTFDSRIDAKIQDAIAARTQVATARLQGEQRVAAATADVQVAEQHAKAIRVSAQAYKDNPGKLKIDLARALCGTGGCPLQVLGGGNASILLNGGK